MRRTLDPVEMAQLAALRRQRQTGCQVLQQRDALMPTGQYHQRRLAQQMAIGSQRLPLITDSVDAGHRGIHSKLRA